MKSKCEIKLKKASMPDEFFNKVQLQKGITVEMEHTKDKEIAKGIAKAHLYEDPNYYRKLKVMEKGVKNASKK